MPQRFTDFCVYTIKHSRDLNVSTNKGNPFPEERSWATAERLLNEAKRDGSRLPVIFSPAESTDYLVAWALVETIDRTPTGIEYTFSNLKPFKAKSLRKSKLKKRDGKPLSENFIRPYAICITPDFLE